MSTRLSAVRIYIHDAKVACFQSFAYEVRVNVDVFRMNILIITKQGICLGPVLAGRSDGSGGDLALSKSTL